MAIRPALLICLVLLAGVAVADPPDELVVVAHPDVPIEALDLRELRRIYLGKTTRWSGGQTIRPVVLDQAEVFDLFVDEMLDRTAENFTTYWKRMVFTGKGRPPRSFATVDEVTFYVGNNPGAIGFLPADSARPGVKLVQIH